MSDYNTLITELIEYGIKTNLIDPMDSIYVTNKMCELCGIYEYVPTDLDSTRELHEILEDLITLMGAQTTGEKDLLDTKIMGLMTPPPSSVIRKFEDLYKESPKLATDWYYSFSQKTNYIRKDRIAKDVKWLVPTEYGNLDITINLSKPEKDPRDIAAAGKAKSTAYPKCLLCQENEGYAGHANHPARQNHRIIPFELMGESYFLQYSPYVYYNEHCIILNKKHIPMVINRGTFDKLLDFVNKFPHYTVGSNADLPIVGGSILSHDHFQGGCYEFPMARAPYENLFVIPGYEDITTGTIKWPMSVIRLTGSDASRIAELADHILNAWRNYSDEKAYIYAETDGVPHNTITPIAHKNSADNYVLDLVLRNNITTDEHPMGVYHPHEEYHHIKKENIGLIEVMGLAILPPRLKKEMSQIEDAIISGIDINTIPEISSHTAWIDTFASRLNGLSKEEIHIVLEEEIGNVFASILECAGVFKRDITGEENFMRFISVL